jgi:hypothetical protein
MSPKGRVCISCANRLNRIAFIYKLGTGWIAPLWSSFTLSSCEQLLPVCKQKVASSGFASRPAPAPFQERPACSLRRATFNLSETTLPKDHVMLPVTQNVHLFTGQYFQKLGRCSARVSINTVNLTAGPQVMEVTVFRRYGRAYIPISKVKDVYVITGAWRELHSSGGGRGI